MPHFKKYRGHGNENFFYLEKLWAFEKMYNEAFESFFLYMPNNYEKSCVFGLLTEKMQYLCP